MKKMIISLLIAIVLPVACRNLDDVLNPTGLNFYGATTYAVGDLAVIYGVNGDRVMMIDPETGEMRLTELRASVKSTMLSADGRTMINLMDDMKTVGIFRQGQDEPKLIKLSNAANDMYISPDGRYAALFLNEELLDYTDSFEGLVSFNMLTILVFEKSGDPTVHTVTVGLKPSRINFNSVLDSETGETHTTRAAVTSISEVILLDLEALPELSKWNVPLTLNPAQVNNPVDVKLAAYSDGEEIVEKAVVITDDAAGDIIIVKNLDGERPSINIQSGISNPQHIFLTDDGSYAVVTSNSHGIAVLDLKEERTTSVILDHNVSEAISVAQPDTLLLYDIGRTPFVTFYNVAEDSAEVVNLDLEIFELHYIAGARYAVAFHTDLYYNGFFQATIIDTVEQKLVPLLLNPAPTQFFLSADGLTAYFLTEGKNTVIEMLHMPDNTRLSLTLPDTPVSSTVFADGQLLFVYDNPTGAYSLYRQNMLISEFDVMIRDLLQ
jgi:hypothetical protein